jgi:hypothetical protein
MYIRKRCPGAHNRRFDRVDEWINDLSTITHTTYISLPSLPPPWNGAPSILKRKTT